MNLERAAAAAWTATTPPSRALIPIDEEPVREKHAGDVRRLLSRFSKARRQLADFRQLDKPAFGRWVALIFRQDLEIAETLQTRLVRARALAERVEFEREDSRASYHEAFRAVMEDEKAGLREDAERAEEEMDAEDAARFADDAPPMEDSDDGGRTFDSDRFDWSFSFLGGPAGGGGGPNADSGPRPVPPAELAKIRYRKLVRLLHPDLRADRDPWAEELWHQAQEAFAARDAERLEALLSIARLRFGDGRDRPLVGEAISAANWLREALRALGSEMRLAKRDDAWGFSRLKDRSRLQRKIAYQIDDDLAELRTELARHEAFLRRCATPPAQRGTPRKSRR